jgi:hypothetical protein
MFLIRRGRLAHAACIALIVSLMSAAAHGWTPAVASQPVLDWEPRSDWVSNDAVHICSERWCSHCNAIFLLTAMQQRTAEWPLLLLAISLDARTAYIYELVRVAREYRGVSLPAFVLAYWAPGKKFMHVFTFST